MPGMHHPRLALDLDNNAVVTCLNHPADPVLTTADPFAEADDDSGQTKQTQEYIHIRIQRMC